MVKNFPTKKIQAEIMSLLNFSKHLNTIMIPTSHNLFQNRKKKHSSTFIVKYQTFIVIPKPDKNSTKKMKNADQ